MIRVAPRKVKSELEVPGVSKKSEKESAMSSRDYKVPGTVRTEPRGMCSSSAEGVWSEGPALGQPPLRGVDRRGTETWKD